ncbi:PKD domain-containing protein [Candidatus Peregrinibacteria bacterium]|nr:PKD domain-containing protein [Candidatus Peregrinibacteria bacterium]
MKNKLFTNRLKGFGILFMIVFTFSFAEVATATVGNPCTTDIQCSGGEYCENEVCVSLDLTTGGTGLSIPTQGATISKDIVQDRTLGALITDIVNYFIGFLGTIAVVAFVYAGVLWVVSGGSEEQITKAKKIMTYAALGLIVVIVSYSVVTFITSSAQRDMCNGACTDTEACQNLGTPKEPIYTCVPIGDTSQLCGECNEDAGEWCLRDRDTGVYSCKVPEGIDWLGNACVTKADCAIGEWCIQQPDGIRYICGPAGTGDTLPCGYDSTNCPVGMYCSEATNTCQNGLDQTCDPNSDTNTCVSPKICDDYGLCRNPNSDINTDCTDNTDCPPNHGFVCNLEKNKCEYGGTEFLDGDTDGDSGDSVDSDDSTGVTDDILDGMDDSIDDLVNSLDDISDIIDGLPEDVKAEVENALDQGMLKDKIADIKELMKNTDNPAVLAALAKILENLERLQDLRKELDDLRVEMPESEKTIKAWDDTSKALDDLIDDPKSSVRLRRFETNYRNLAELLRKFPVVISRISAAPSSGNVPFTVTFDGLDSIDPTGGTISEYKWSYLDNSGTQVSLGSSPVIVHEFTEPNTYSVRLQVSTSKTDSMGYKSAMDGISTVRVRANPPASKVAFRINGVEVNDVHHVTIEEGKAGLAFDPSPTTPAVGKSIVKYEWLYGDTATEQRSTPTTVVHSYDKPGEYFITLKVTDNQGTVDKRVIKLFVKSLAADINVAPKEGNVNTQFRFIGVNSRSDDGSIKTYEWEIQDVDRQTVHQSDEESFYYQFDKPGTYDVTLLVTDTTGAKDKHVGTLKVFSRPPIASFTYEIPEANHPNKVEFNGINSYDPDQGDRITYSWDFDGDGNFDVVDSPEITSEFEYKKVGEYRATLQVQDSFGQREQIEKGVSIQSVLSGDISLESRAAQVGEEVTFKAQSPNAVAYLWEFGDGQTSSTDEDSVTYTYTKKGKYRVKLNFFDKDDNDNSDYAYVLIGDQDSPIAAATALVNSRSQGFVDDLCGPGKHGMIVTRADNILLTARDSINRDGSSRLLSYDWTVSGGTRSDRKEFTHRFDEINGANQCFEANLVVRDQVSGKVSNEDIAYFKVVNEIPSVVDFSIVGEEDGVTLVTPAKVTLRAIAPKDKDGQIKKYRWWYFREGYEDQKLGVHSTSAPETSMIITAQGQPDVINKYYFVMEITDNDGGVYNSMERFGELSSLEVQNGPNLSPVAEFTVDKTTISTGDSISFISKSYDPQGDILPDDAYRWDFDGDGEFDDISSGPQVNRQFNTPGEYEVRLKVTYRGLSSSTSQKIFVEQVDSYPQAAFTYSIDGDTVTFNASNSRYDPDLSDTTLRYEWDFDIQDDDNGNGINDDDVQSTEESPSYIYSESGIYRVRLKVKDSLGMEGVVVRDVDLAMSATEREKNSYYSAKVTSPNQPITTMDIVVSPDEVIKGGTTDIKVTVKNADNSPYYGDVYFEVVDGSGTFTPNPVKSKGSGASSIFTAVDSGTVRIRVRATDTFFGEISEEAAIRVK